MTPANLQIANACGSIAGIRPSAESGRTPENAKPRLIVVLIRGGLDGLAAVQPYGDGMFAKYRKPSRDSLPRMHDLDGFFALHPALSNHHAFFQEGELLIFHAVAGSWRNRSHFMSQVLLESGADQPQDTGWLNRLATELATTVPCALTFDMTRSLALRGPAPVAIWAPLRVAGPSPRVYSRIANLHRQDPLTSDAIPIGVGDRKRLTEAITAASLIDSVPSFESNCLIAGHLLAEPNEFRIALIETGGFDTHKGQEHRLNLLLRKLDNGLKRLKEGLGENWQNTAILVMTEFGRSIRMNGTGGTDHGTATAAFLLGGNMHGGCVRSEWPGLARTQLFEDRDLYPTQDLRGIIKGVLGEHLGISTEALGRIFPGDQWVCPYSGLVRPPPSL